MHYTDGHWLHVKWPKPDAPTLVNNNGLVAPFRRWNRPITNGMTENIRHTCYANFIPQISPDPKIAVLPGT